MIRHEYPRPDLVRPYWWPLNGTWNFSFDDGNVGLQEKWFAKPQFDMQIEVPFAFQTKLSGIGDPSFHDHMWYHRKFNLQPFDSSRSYVLRFQAVDYRCRVYVDGHFLGEHVGGQAPFHFDITPFIHGAEDHDLVVYVEDPSTDLHLPRGKQYWKEKSESIWYTRTSGIWQSVWIEEVAREHVASIRFTPQFDQGTIKVELELSALGRQVAVTITDHDGTFNTFQQLVTKLKTSLTMPVFVHDADWRTKSWSPENPYLFDVTFRYDVD